jgi:hypothetical protein
MYTMLAPAGMTGEVTGMPSGTIYQIGANGTITSVAQQDVGALRNIGFQMLATVATRAIFLSPNAADLVSVKAAATPADGTITIAAQPDVPRKLQIRIVIGTTTTTRITAGTLTLVGEDQDANAVTEVISLIQSSSATLKTAHAYSKLTSGAVAAYAAAGSGTGNTLGIGCAVDLGVSTVQGVTNFALVKESLVTIGTGTEDETSGATVDAVARTVAPSTAPAPTTNGYEIVATYDSPSP